MHSIVVNITVIIFLSTMDLAIGLIASVLKDEKFSSAKMHTGLCKKSLNIFIYLIFEVIVRYMATYDVDLSMTIVFSVLYIIGMELVSINESLEKCGSGLSSLISLLRKEITNDENK